MLHITTNIAIFLKPINYSIDPSLKSANLFREFKAACIFHYFLFKVRQSMIQAMY